jgi:two-component system, NtrC family, sensor histidine kinase PilS
VNHPPLEAVDPGLTVDTFTSASANASSGGPADPGAFERLYRSFVAARAVLALALVGTLVLGHSAGFRTAVPTLLAVGYAAFAVTLWLLPRFRFSPPSASNQLSPQRWFATIGVDLLLFSALALTDRSAVFNFSPLLLLPVLMAALLSSRLAALAVAACASLVLLAAALTTALRDGKYVAELAPAGFVGMGLFATALVASQVAQRLAGEQDAARASRASAQRQAEINQLVIAEMSHGVLAVDRDGWVHAANPAGLTLLGLGGAERAQVPAQLQSLATPATADLQRLVHKAFSAQASDATSHNIAFNGPGGETRMLAVRCKLAPPSGGDNGGGTGLCVLIVEDERDVHRRVQQEKLAAMGRVSAGIAHEIRNPLSAIAQANALLQETAAAGEQQMLTRMVADNVNRLKRIVDDVMEVAPKGPVEELVIDAVAAVDGIVDDWVRTNHSALGPRERLHLALPEAPMPVTFDVEHLRRVLVNLLDNARRYATSAAGAITLSLSARDDYQAELSVSSDGEPIAADVAPYLFEPFFSTRSRGTGLGLYICKELCERYGGAIDYLALPPGGDHVNRFLITLRRVQSASSPAAEATAFEVRTP